MGDLRWRQAWLLLLLAEGLTCSHVPRAAYGGSYFSKSLRTQHLPSRTPRFFRPHRRYRGQEQALRGQNRWISYADTSNESDQRDFSFREYLSNLFKGQAAQGNAEKLARKLAGPAPSSPKDRWPWWFVLPIQPGEFRLTDVREVVTGQVWSFEQMQGAINIIVNIRMTVFKVKEGLLVYSPVAPTRDVIAQLRELEAEHGPVKHILLPTLAVEHKVFFGPFARKFPKAALWACPGQWSWPIPLPFSLLGSGIGRRVNILTNDVEGLPDEVDVGVIGPIQTKRRNSSSLYSQTSQFGEVGLYHKPTRSLALTDSLVYIQPNPPPICTRDPAGLLFHARDTEGDAIENTDAKRKEGWAKITLLALYILPGSLDISDPKESFIWGDWKASFEALSGALIAAPFLQQLVFRRYQLEVQDWVSKLRTWDIKRVIPAHFSIAESVKTSQVIDAYEKALITSPRPSEETEGGEAKSEGVKGKKSAQALEQGSLKAVVDRDMKFLSNVDGLFERSGILPKA